ncbi:MAG: glycosyltransferase [Nitrospirae bacterium]|nr:MAG: glycosyltransferase [Nitrospirota bacterium]
MSALKILYLTSHWPGAPPYGAQQRTLQIGRLLQKLGDVRLVMVNVDDDGERWRQATEKEFELARVVNVKPVSSHGLLGRLRHEFDPRYLQTDHATADPEDRQAVLDLLEQHDLVWIYHIRPADLVRIYRWPRSVMDVDDIPSRFYQSSGQTAVSRMRRLRDRRMALIWKRREHKLPERFTVLTVSSEDDRRYLGIEGVRVLPNGFEPRYPVERRPGPIVGFIGTFRWSPNVEGVHWFCHDVWPLIKRHLPDARLRLVGEATEVARDWGDGVEGLGRIADAGPEIATWSTMIVPIRVGGGTRIKVLEAFARKCPVVATRLGAFGYDLQDGQELFLADRPDTFASRCIDLLRSPQIAEAIAERAYRRFLQCWTWESYAPIVEAVVEEVLNGPAGGLRKGHMSALLVSPKSELQTEKDWTVEPRW